MGVRYLINRWEIRSAIIFLLLCFTSSVLVAQERNSNLQNITLEEAINKALDQNNLVKAGKMGLKKADWDVKRAWTQLFPTLSFQTRYTWIDDRTFAERDFRRYLPAELANQFPQTVFQTSYYSSFDLNMSLFNGMLVNGLSIAYEQQSMSENLYNSTRQETVFYVITTYLNILKDRELVALQNEYLQLSRLNYERAERLYLANRYSQNEALRWKVDLQQQKSNVVTYESTLRGDLLNMSRLINSAVNEKTMFESKLPGTIIDAAETLKSLNEEGLFALADLSGDDLLKVNAALAAAKSSKTISELLHRNSYANYLPNVSLSYSYGWRENDNIELDDYSPKTFMINFSVPIFTSFQNYTELKSTYYEYKKNEEELNDRLLNTKLVLNNIINRLVNLKTQIELSEANTEFTANNYKIVEQQKERGLVSNIEYIDAKLNLQNAKLQLITNQYDFISSMLEYYYLTGKIEQFIR